MAITVKQTPAAFAPAHKNNLFVVSSDNTGQPNFKYVFDVYVAAVLVARVKVLPEPEYSYGVFNASRIIQSYVSNNYFKGAKDVLQEITAEGSFKVSYVIKYGEEYGVPLTTYTNLVTSATITAYNYYSDILPANLANHANRFLSSRPRVQRVGLADYSYISYFNPDGIAKTATINSYDSAGVLLATNTAASSAELMQIGYGPANINYAVPVGDRITGGYYTVEVKNTDGSGSVETLTCIVDNCTKYKSYQLVFLNKLGGFDTVPMRYKSTRTVNMERKSFGLNTHRLAAGGTTSIYESGTTDVLLGGERTYSVSQRTSFRLTTASLDEFEFAWLAELAASPLVYLQLSERNTRPTGNQLSGYNSTSLISEESLSGDVVHYPVKLNLNAYELKGWQHGLSALEVEAEILQTFNSQ